MTHIVGWKDRSRTARPFLSARSRTPQTTGDGLAYRPLSSFGSCAQQPPPPRHRPPHHQKQSPSQYQEAQRHQRQTRAAEAHAQLVQSLGRRGLAFMFALAIVVAIAGADWSGGSVRLFAQPGEAPGVPAGAAPLVYVAAVDDVIQPVSAEFMIDAIDTADTHGAAALIFTLETPGGLVDATRTIIARMISARTPIVVFVGPGSARAASAGFLITLAADVAVMSPGAHIGAAHPVSGGGEKMDETMAAKVASDIAAYARSLAQARQRNVELSDEAVRNSRAFTADEAMKSSPPLIDFVSPDLDTLLRTLDGRTIRRFDGRAATIRTAGARTEPLEMTRRQRFLSTIAHPQIAYVLFSLGLLGLTVELWNPGAILPGVVGAVSLLLAFLAFQVLPINTTGLLLVALGLVLLVLELKVPSYGVLGIGGTASLILGSVIMMNRTTDMRASLIVVLPAMLTLAGIFLFLGRLALTAQMRPAASGAPAMIGTPARAVSAIPPHGSGQVATRGELWTAVATRAVRAGAEVRIIGREGLTLTVEPIEPVTPEGGSAS